MAFLDTLHAIADTREMIRDFHWGRGERIGRDAFLSHRFQQNELIVAAGHSTWSSRKKQVSPSVDFLDYDTKVRMLQFKFNYSAIPAMPPQPAAPPPAETESSNYLTYILVVGVFIILCVFPLLALLAYRLTFSDDGMFLDGRQQEEQAVSLDVDPRELLKPRNGPVTAKEGEWVRRFATALMDDFTEHHSRCEVYITFGSRQNDPDSSGMCKEIFYAVSVMKACYDRGVQCYCHSMSSNPNRDEFCMALSDSRVNHCKLLIVLQTTALYTCKNSLREIYFAIQNKMTLLPLRFEVSNIENGYEWPQIQRTDLEGILMLTKVQESFCKLNSIPSPPYTVPDVPEVLQDVVSDVKRRLLLQKQRESSPTRAPVQETRRLSSKEEVTPRPRPSAQRNSQRNWPAAAEPSAGEVPVTFGRPGNSGMMESSESAPVHCNSEGDIPCRHIRSDEPRRLNSEPDRHTTQTEHEGNLAKGDRVVVVKDSRTKGKMAVVLDPHWKEGLVQVDMDVADQKGKVKSFKYSDLIKTERFQGLREGDRVVVIKDARTKGRTGMVIDPAWEGLVQVRLDLADEKGSTKSYQSCDLKLLKERGSGFRVGDRVVVIKEARTKGRAGTVTNPSWQNLVQVEMDVSDEKGKLKSYKASDLALIQDKSLGMREGDRVVVVKDARTKGKTGRVTEIDYNGLVKVEMEEPDAKGNVKSYKTTDLQIVKDSPTANKTTKKRKVLVKSSGTNKPIPQAPERQQATLKSQASEMTAEPSCRPSHTVSDSTAAGSPPGHSPRRRKPKPLANMEVPPHSPRKLHPRDGSPSPASVISPASPTPSPTPSPTRLHPTTLEVPCPSATKAKDRKNITC